MSVQAEARQRWHLASPRTALALGVLAVMLFAAALFTDHLIGHRVTSSLNAT